MIDIYNEIGYIKTVLQDGLSEKWERDATLLVRFFKNEGYKKSEVKKKIKEKCENSKKFQYNPFTMYNRINKIVDNAWKKEVPLREIKNIEFSQEVLQWFLNLETNFTITDEQVLELKEKRPKLVIKNNVINWQRTKYLFTLYIWTKIQENYLEKPYIHYLNQYNKRFKQDAYLKQSFNMSKERDLLYDLGFIYVNFALGIDATFVRNNDVFQIPVADKNRIVLSGEDLYNCGYWLEKQKMGTFVCQCCGKTFAHYSKSSREYARKYCKECSDKLFVSKIGGRRGEAKKTQRYCIDCGKECVILSNNDFKTCRCPECQEKRRREQNRIRMREKREKEKEEKLK